MAPLTFCSNILPGKSCEEHFAHLEKSLPHIKRQLPWLKTLGLRLSAKMVSELMTNKEVKSRLVSLLEDHELLISTVNAFPMHDFHKPGLKDKVYIPDWSSSERYGYTRGCAIVLAQLPTTPDVSISTVPLGYKAHHSSRDLDDFLLPVLNIASELKDIFHRTGKTIRLALEPEPDCLLETTSEVTTFFEKLYAADHMTRVEDRKTHLGLCFDTCHFAVNFESPKVAVETLTENDVSIFKVQLSNALKWGPNLPKESLILLYDETYLHQIRGRKANGDIAAFADAPSNAELLQSSFEEWRCHFHTPIFQKEYDSYSSTQEQIIETLLATQDMKTICYEVETYTWGVLPETMKPKKVEDCIVKELEWAKEQIHSKTTGSQIEAPLPVS